MSGFELNKLKSLIQDLGCTNEEDIPYAYYVFQELYHVQQYFNVNYHFNKEINLLYLHGQRLQGDSHFDIFIPIKVNFIISPSWLKKIFSLFLTNNPLQQRIILSYVQKDSSVVFHRINQGLIPPLSPNSSKKLEDRNKEKIRYLKTLKNNEKTEEN